MGARPLRRPALAAIGLGVVVLNAVFGTLIGALAGYFRKLDNP
jgi:ABC-type dipeptide/oligopeptide/nickel transport system permease subunit